MKKLLLILALGVYGLTLTAQPLNRPTYASMIQTAEEQMEKKDYYRALEWYEKAYEESRDPELAIILADLNYMLRDYRDASRWYSRALRPSRRNKKAEEWQEKRFEYARSLKMEEQYDEAIEEFDKFIRTTTDPVKKELAEQEKVGCEFARVAQPVENLTVSNAGKNVNTKISEYSPYLSPDNSELYYSSLNSDEVIELDEDTEDYHAKIYKSARTEKGWAKGEALDDKVNRPGFFNVNVKLSPDGKRMFFNRETIEGNVLVESKIYVSEKTGSGWSAAKELESVNGDYIAKSPAVGELFGKEVLFFVSDMDGGYGGYDIYYATYKGGGQYGDPVNLGPQINTVGDEETPFYREGILYFSSTGHPGIGGYDIFMSTWDGTRWSKPVNMGKGYNSSVDDLYFMLDKEGYTGVLASNRPAEGARSLKGKTCCNDIYNISLKKIEAALVAKILDLDTKEPLVGGTVELYESKDGEMVLVDSKTNKAGNGFDWPLELDKAYMIVGSADNYEKDTVSFNTIGLLDSKVYEEVLELKPGKKTITIRREEPFVLQNIYYDFDDDKILPDAERDLQVILELMNEYPDMVIELSSHTDSRGTEAYNRNLSQRRAESARRWLVAKGVERRRIQAKGYGESQPKVVDERVKERFPFLNVGDTLTEEYINSLLPDTAKFEAAHQVNRRTEFKIIDGPTSITIEEERLIQIGNRKVDEKIKEEVKPGGKKENNEKPGGNSVKEAPIDLELSRQQRPPIHQLSSLYGKKDLSGLPIMHFEERVHDFGTVKKGEVKTHVFTFTNLGEVPLAIDIATSCDCTTLDYSTSEVKPGESGKIKVTFDSGKKDEDETVDVDIYLKNIDPEIGAPIFERVQYTYHLVK
ncbi:MAG: OmpA family protein [Saprospiraceae bacterium]